MHEFSITILDWLFLATREQLESHTRARTQKLIRLNIRSSPEYRIDLITNDIVNIAQVIDTI